MIIKIIIILNLFLLNQIKSEVLPDSIKNQIKKYSRILNQNPNILEANLAIGNILYESEKFNEAEKFYKKSIKSDKIKLKGKSYYNLGNSQFRQGKYAESLSSFKKSIELFPEDIDAKFNYEMSKKMIENQEKSSKNKSNDKNNTKEDELSNNDKENSNNTKEDELSNNDKENSNNTKEDELSNNDKENSKNSQDDILNDKGSEKTKLKDYKPDAENILNALKADMNNLIRHQIQEKKTKALSKDW